MSEDPTSAATPGGSADGPDEATRQIRGSSLLLVGRVIALGMGFVAQIVTVRYLTRGEYGAFAYGLSLVSFAESLTLLGFDRAVTRFIPIYDEQGDLKKLWGLVVMVLGTILSFGLAVILVVVGLSGLLTRELEVPSAALVIAILIPLGPLMALDRLGTSLLAIFTSPRSIFFRKFVLGPGLRLLAVLALVLSGSDVVFLAGGYVVAGVLGVIVYGAILRSALRSTGRLKPGVLRDLSVPWREVLGFSLPLLTTDIVFSTLTSIDGVMLGNLRGALDVAALRAVQPVARLNQLVLESFGVLFTPTAARLFARAAHRDVNRLYWRTASWVAILSFPIVALTFGVAGPITTLLFGDKYADAGPIMALLSVGYYVHASFGFNGMVLNVYSRVRAVVTVNLAAALLNVVLNLAMIPRYGARGAATATMITLFTHNLMKQAALGRFTPVHGVDRDFVRPYLIVGAGLAVMVGMELLVAPPLLVALGVAVVVSMLVLWLTHRSLALAETFPEIGRVPLLGRLVGGGR